MLLLSSSRNVPYGGATVHLFFVELRVNVNLSGHLHHGICMRAPPAPPCQKKDDFSPEFPTGAAIYLGRPYHSAGLATAGRKPGRMQSITPDAILKIQAEHAKTPPSCQTTTHGAAAHVYSICMLDACRTSDINAA